MVGNLYVVAFSREKWTYNTWVAHCENLWALRAEGTAAGRDTFVLAADRRRIEVSDIAALVGAFAIEQVAPDEQTATLAAIARLSLPLDFGDCFASTDVKLTAPAKAHQRRK